MLTWNAKSRGDTAPSPTMPSTCTELLSFSSGSDTLQTLNNTFLYITTLAHLILTLCRCSIFCSSLSGNWLLCCLVSTFLYFSSRASLSSDKSVGQGGLERKGKRSCTESSWQVTGNYNRYLILKTFLGQQKKRRWTWRDCFQAREAAWNCARVARATRRWARSSPAWRIYNWSEASCTAWPSPPARKEEAVCTSLLFLHFPPLDGTSCQWRNSRKMKNF